MSEVSKIEAYWDDQEGVNPGWYAREVNANGWVCDDSMKVGFPVDLDEFDQSDEAGVTAALAEAFPEHEIYVYGSQK